MALTISIMGQCNSVFMVHLLPADSGVSFSLWWMGLLFACVFSLALVLDLTVSWPCKFMALSSCSQPVSLLQVPLPITNDHSVTDIRLDLLVNGEDKEGGIWVRRLLGKKIIRSIVDKNVVEASVWSLCRPWCVCSNICAPHSASVRLGWRCREGSEFTKEQ